MVVAPACDEHGSPAAFDQALQEARAEIERLRKVVDAACEWLDITSGKLTVPRLAVLAADGNLAQVIDDYRAVVP
jgi:hypothetical protein